MKPVFFFVFALFVVAWAAPAEEKPIAILRSEFVQQPEGSYNFGYETENGIKVSEEGQLKEAVDEENKPRVVVVVRGSYAYTNADGTPELITYYADETGFHPIGDSIPTAPPARR